MNIAGPNVELTVHQDYDFDYSDDGDDANESGSADVENQYYTAKCMSSSPPTFLCSEPLL